MLLRSLDVSAEVSALILLFTNTSTNTNTLLSGGVIAAAYLCGSLPTGVWVGRRAGVNVRRAGSGNIGATNVARTAGARAALVTLAGDVLKGLLPVLLARALALSPWGIAGVGLAAILGHICSVFLRLRGGKGVATACGAFLGIAPLAVAVALAAFAVLAVTTRYVSLASVVATIALPVASLAIGYDTPVWGSAFCAAILIVSRHRDNLSRLLQGRESKFALRH